MKKNTVLPIVLFMVATFAIIVGCASPNPAFNPAQPPSATNPPYVPNTNVTTGVAIGQGVNAVTTPVNPYSGLVDIGLGAAAAIAAWIAKRKNDQAAAANDHAAQQTAVANQLAASVVAQGNTVAQSVLDHASTNEAVFPAVADAVNRKTLV
jgi:hypothetical protein